MVPDPGSMAEAIDPIEGPFVVDSNAFPTWRGRETPTLAIMANACGAAEMIATRRA